MTIVKIAVLSEKHNGDILKSEGGEKGYEYFCPSESKVHLSGNPWENTGKDDVA